MREQKRLNSFALGIDGGGSKTRAVVVDAQGNECGRGLADSSNYNTVGVERAIEHIRAAVEEAVMRAGCSLPVKVAWLGLAGIDRPADHDRLLPHLRFIAESVRLTNDAELVLGALEEKAGVAVIAGTGSIVWGQDGRGRVERTGGWGHVFGDEGSGYDLGRRALQAAAKAADGRGPETSLLKLILHHWNLASPDEMIGKVYGDNDTAAIAGLSSLVFQAANEGDRTAYKIMQEAVRELVHAIVTVAGRLDLQEKALSLALGGGLLLNEARFRSLMLRSIDKHLAIEQVVFVEQPALSAARAALSIPGERTQTWNTPTLPTPPTA
jgi:N-acetylglucosamine kinase-like BadF-type ATPase